MSELTEKALALHRAGKLREAEAQYRAALEANAADPEALRLLGILKTQQGEHEKALALVTEALGHDPASAKAHATLGSILHALNRYDDAVASYDRAIAIAPDVAGHHYNRGVALQAARRHADAIASFDLALDIDPSFAEAYTNRGNALRAVGRHADALASYDRALAVKPDFAEALTNRGTALQALGRYAEAIASYDRAFAVRPDSGLALFNRGVALHALGRYAEALASYDKALAVRPDSVEALFNRGNTLQALDRHGEALESYRKALAINPEHADARWALAMCQLPAVYGDVFEAAQCRAAFARQLEELDRWFDPARLERGVTAVGTHTPFYLAYQEESNRELLQSHGALCTRIMTRWLDRQALPAAGSSAGDVVRIGVVSSHLHDHSVWNAIVKGWFQQLDRERFCLDAFHLGAIEDQETLWLRSRAAHFASGARGLREWVDAIVGRHPDVLIYPEIGMDAMTVKLASLRLAPAQVASWGHPETTGLPTIDYFLSARDLEPADAQANYVERLVTLPHLGCFYQSGGVEVRPPDLAALGVDPGLPLLVCPGVPFKYAPQHDRILAAIARALGRCQFIFFVHPTRELSDKLHRRLGRVFASEGLDVDRFVVFVPWQRRESFHGLLERADAFLDTIGFSGFNTAMQAVECSLPIVTREGRFLRGRLASGILKRMGLGDLVAHSEDEYVAFAVRLCRDADHRTRTRERIRKARHLLVDDVTPIRALEDFLISVAS